jgi:WD40 repeat protein
VFVVDVAGGVPEEMGEFAMPRWSSDDKQLALHADGSTGVKRGVWIQNIDGKGREWLADGFCPRWSPDGGRILFCGRRSLSILDLVGAQEYSLLDEAFEEIYFGMDWSPDGKRVAFVGRRDGPRELWIVDAEGASKGKTLRLSGNLGGNVAWRPDGKQLAIVVDKRITLIDPDGTQPPGPPIPGQEGDNREPAWSPDGQWLAFSGDRATPRPTPRLAAARQWKLVEARRHAKGSIVYGAAFTPDGRRLVMGGDPVSEGVQLWDLASGQTKSLGGQGISIAMFPDGKRFATNWLGPSIQIIDIDSGDITRQIDHGNTVRTIALSKDGTRLVSGALDNLLHIWDVSTGERITTFDQHKTWITRALFSPDGQDVFSGGQDKQLCIWNAKTGKLRARIEHPDTVWGLAVSPDGRQILSGTGGPLRNNPTTLIINPGDDNVIRLFDTAGGKLIREMKGHTHAVYTLDIAPDGALAVSGGWDGTVRLWDLRSGEELSRVEDWKGGVMKVLFSPDGKQVLVGGGVSRTPADIIDYPDEQVRMFNVAESRPEAK